MSDRWYWKKRGQVVGPLTTEELHEHIQHRRVGDGDSFRLDETEEWLSAAQIKALFQEQSASAAAKSAADVLAAKHQWVLKQQGSPKIDRGSYFPFLGTLGEWIGEGFSIVSAWLSAALEWVFRYIPRPGRKTAAVAIIVGTLAIVLRDFRFDAQANGSSHQRLTATWNQMESMRKDSATEEEWNRFASETLAWLTPHIDELTRRAKTKPSNGMFWSSEGYHSAQARRELLCAAECMSRVLRNAPHEEPDAENAIYFTRHMQDASAFMTGDIERQMHERNMAIHPALRGKGITRKATAGYDPLYIGIIAVDAIVVGAFLIWLIRRSRIFA